MIRIKRKEPKNYLTMIEEAFSKIPLYSKEWTNFNPSDPGVTLLEVITAFNSLQSNQLGLVADDVKEKLLKLMGFTAREGRCGRVLLAAENVTDDFYLPNDQKFRIGDINFETNRRSIVHANSISSIISVASKKVIDCSSLIDRNSTMTVRIFGDKPAVGDELYIFLEKEPLRDTELIFYFGFDDRFHRTPGGDRHENIFAAVKWQYYTKDGFVDLRTKDATRAFLNGGELRLSIPRVEGAKFKKEGREGYVLRAVLERADYDVPPRFFSVHGFLFEVWQKETRSICHTFKEMDELEIYCDLLEEDYVNVFVRESRKGSYRLYEDSRFRTTEKGRFFDREKEAYGLYKYLFNKEKYGYGPGSGMDSIKIVAYNEELMRQRMLDTVIGYDDQDIELPVQNVVPESFTLIAKRTIDGEDFYDFVRPDRNKPGELYYTLDERKGHIYIRDAGDYIGAELYICSCAVTMGSEGNVRPGNTFIPIGYETNVRFYNPYIGEGGRLKENLDELTARFTEDLNTPYTAVKKSDYEDLVRTIPDLCIHKVKAIADSAKNEVTVVVKPYSDTERSLLPSIYVNKIKDFLDERRVLSTRIKVAQPTYVPIEVNGMIYVRKHYENSMEEIRKVIEKHLDYISGKQNFGETLKFDALFTDIEELDCVDHIYELSIKPENSNAIMSGLDVIPAENALCCAGRISIELNMF
ncbi:MAG: baseplate J/gp47 family protein [Lachnospiraceae bacterium]|nr:baseplate J/gp47 family protein [Lachnospiraceae bacterium]